MAEESMILLLGSLRKLTPLEVSAALRNASRNGHTYEFRVLAEVVAEEYEELFMELPVGVAIQFLTFGVKNVAHEEVLYS